MAILWVYWDTLVPYIKREQTADGIVYCDLITIKVSKWGAVIQFNYSIEKLILLAPRISISECQK